LIELCNHPEPHIKESYRSLFVFLPSAYPDLKKHLSLIVPIFFEGLKDDLEEIRKLS